MSVSAQAPQAGNDQAAQMQGVMKMMRYFFPIMIVWMGRSFPAGLALYWFIGNFLAIGQTLLLRKMRKRAIEKVAAGKQKK
jgi:YidC/Oxa1 family membrane protein insertase